MNYTRTYLYTNNSQIPRWFMESDDFMLYAVKVDGVCQIWARSSTMLPCPDNLDNPMEVSSRIVGPSYMAIYQDTLTICNPKTGRQVFSMPSASSSADPFPTLVRAWAGMSSSVIMVPPESITYEVVRKAAEVYNTQATLQVRTEVNLNIIFCQITKLQPNIAFTLALY